MILEVYQRRAYGRDLIYPNNDAARVLASLVGTTTLSLANLELATKLGHSVKVVSDPRAKSLSI